MLSTSGSLDDLGSLSSRAILAPERPALPVTSRALSGLGLVRHFHFPTTRTVVPLHGGQLAVAFLSTYLLLLAGFFHLAALDGFLKSRTGR